MEQNKPGRYVRPAHKKWYKTSSRQSMPSSMGDASEIGHRMLNWVYGQRFARQYWRDVKKDNRRIMRHRLKHDLKVRLMPGLLFS